MKTNALVLGAALGLLAASATQAQQSSHLSAEYLKLATPLIHWPRGLEPRNVDVFVHNEGWIHAPPEVVWANLIDAAQWPSWYSNAANVRIEGGATKLAKGVSFTWTTFGFPIHSTVDIFEPNREIGWNVDTHQFRVHHAWLLLPERTPSSSGSSSRMRCTTATTGGWPRSRPARSAWRNVEPR